LGRVPISLYFIRASRPIDKGEVSTVLYPSIDELVLKVDSKYTLVVAASLRAHDLRRGDPSKIKDPKSSKEVGIALEEIYSNRIVVEHLYNEEDDD
jgi:DNA-directed RNA polymerase subunit omega